MTLRMILTRALEVHSSHDKHNAPPLKRSAYWLVSLLLSSDALRFLGKHLESRWQLDGMSLSLCCEGLVDSAALSDSPLLHSLRPLRAIICAFLGKPTILLVPSASL